MVRCEVCGRYFLAINNAHLATHDLTADGYEGRYPGAERYSVETRSLMSESGQEKVFTQEHCDAISEANRKVVHDAEWNGHVSEALTGRVFSEETLLKMSGAASRRGWAPEYEEYRELRAELTRKQFEGKPLSLEHRRSIGDALRGVPKSEDHKRRNSEARKENWLDPEYVEMMVEAFQRRPTWDEVWLDIYLQKHFPGQWAYNGDGREKVVIGGRVPDFVRSDGRKLVIEMFGSYHHGPTFTDETEEDKIIHYRGYGFGCLVLWDDEVRENVVVEKVKEFANEVST